MKKNKILFFIALTLFALLPFQALAMVIEIKDPSNYNFKLEVESSDTIEAVKNKIYDKMILNSEINPILPGSQILFFNDKVMNDGRTLADYNCEKDDVIFLGHILEIVFDANEGNFENGSIFKLDNWNAKSYDMLPVPTRKGYAFKNYFTEKNGGRTITSYIDDEGINNDITFYAQWVPIVDKISIDFTKISNLNELNDNKDYVNAFLFIALEKNLIIDNNNEGIDKNGKKLFSIDDTGALTLSKDLTEEDNINYVLTEEDKKLYIEEKNIESIPNEIEIIFVKKQYKVTFDANEGNFKDGKILTIDNWTNEDQKTLEEPTRDGYKFLGYYTEKIGGTKLELILAESGIDNDMTFYAQWEENSKEIPSQPEQEDIKETPIESEEENPKTLDEIYSNIFIGTIALIGLVGGTIYLMKKNKAKI